MPDNLEFKDFTSDDYETFLGMELEDEPRVAELHGNLDGKRVNFVIIATAYSLYINAYEPIVDNNVDTDLVCEFIRTTSGPQKGKSYKGESIAQLIDWQNVQTEHMENFGFERIDFQE